VVDENDVYFTHNDSGALACFFKFNLDGMIVGKTQFLYATRDCEDCSSNIVNGKKTYILADVGDNAVNRKGYNILVRQEGPLNLLSMYNIPFMYADGKSRNCESCILNEDGTITLITKNYPLISGPTQEFTIHSILSGSDKTIVEPKPLVRLPAKYTIMSADKLGDRTVLLGGGYAHIFLNNDLGSVPIRITMPKSLQPEAICFSHDGKKLIMTSETNKTPGALTDLYIVTL
jgi:hypothetical protein